MPRHPAAWSRLYRRLSRHRNFGTIGLIRWPAARLARASGRPRASLCRNACAGVKWRSGEAVNSVLLAAAKWKTRLRKSHDVDENKATYGRIEKNVRNHISLKISRLEAPMRRRGSLQGELKMRAKATMLLKIKAGRRSVLIKATMFMRTHHLHF